MFSEIPLQAIEGMQPSTKVMVHATIQFAVRNPQGQIDKIVLSFLKSGFGGDFDMSAKRANERDEWLNAVQKARDKLVAG